jgi:hypothetical protein
MVSCVIFRASSVAAFFIGFTVVQPALATDKAQCASAAEVGQRLFKSHKLVSAREQLLICSSKDCPDVISQDCTQWLGEVVRSVASVVFKAVDDGGKPLDDVKVTENGVVVTEHAGEGAAIEVDPGVHAFRFEKPDYDYVEQQVKLDEGRHNQEISIVMRLHSTTTPPPPPPTGNGASSGTGLLVGAVTATSLAVIGAGVFIGAGLAGTSDQNALKTSCAPNCSPSQVSPVQTKFTVANVGLVTGAIALVAAGVFWVLYGTRAPDKHVGLSGVTFSF